MKNNFALILFFIITFLCNEVYAQGSGEQKVLGQSVSASQIIPDTFDLKGAIKYSLSGNNGIRAMKKALSAVERDIGIEKSDMLPHLRFNENFLATNNPTDALSMRLNQARATDNDLSIANLNHPSSVTNFLTAGIAEQKILDKKAVIEIKMAKKEYSASAYFFMRKQEELVNQVSQAFLKVITNKEFLSLAELSLNDANKNLAEAALIKKKTSVPDSDFLRAKSAVIEREEKLVSAKRNLDVSKMNLALLLGLEYPVDVTGKIPNIDFYSLDYYKKISMNRNDIKATSLRVENSKNYVSAAKADWLPTLTSYFSYNIYNNGYPFGGQGFNYTAAAFFKWDIFDGNKRKYEILKAKDKEAEAQEYLIGLKKTVSFKIYETYSNIEEHKHNLELSLKNQEEAEKDKYAVLTRWKKSQLTFVSVIDAQDNLDAARFAVIKNDFDLKEDLINICFESGIIYQILMLN